MSLRGVTVSCMAALMIAASSLAGATTAPPPDVRFDSVRVIDLSGRPLRTGRIDGKPVGTLPLRDSDAAAILAAPTIIEGDHGLSFVDDLAKCAALDSAPLASAVNETTCLRRFEEGRVKGQDGVSRAGERLVIRPKSGVPLPFVDFDLPESATADGDSVRHVYLGRVGAGQLHHVEIGFRHDSPGAFLINPNNGKNAFVHKGGDIAALAPGGAQIVVFNTMNPPLSLAVASLDAAGPSLELHCSASGDAADRIAEFKGWHDADSFDLVLRKNRAAPDAHPLPLRLIRAGTDWRIARTDPALPGALAGFACRAYAPET